jgi:hypothetical protein
MEFRTVQRHLRPDVSELGRAVLLLAGVRVDVSPEDFHPAVEVQTDDEIAKSSSLAAQTRPGSNFFMTTTAAKY